MSISKPCTIKVKSGIYINISTIISFAIDLGLAQTIPILKEDGDPKNKEDWEQKIITADTVSFYWPADKGLSFRVGHEIERSDFERIKRILVSLEYKERASDGKSDTIQTP